MKCANSIVLHEQIRKVYVNGRLDHEVSNGIGICAFDMKGGVRVISSWPKREKVLKINGIEVLFIGRTAEGYPIVWMPVAKVDAMSIAGDVSVTDEISYDVFDDLPWTQDELVVLTNVELGPILSRGVFRCDVIGGYQVYDKTLPDLHVGVDSPLVHNSVDKDGKMVLEVVIDGLWNYKRSFNNHYSTSGIADHEFKVAKLSVSAEPGPIEAEVETYGEYTIEGASLFYLEHDKITVRGLTCSIEDCEED